MRTDSDRVEFHRPARQLHKFAGNVLRPSEREHRAESAESPKGLSQKGDGK